MMIVSVEEAREHLADLIAHVAAGEDVVITAGGQSVAQLVGPPMFPTTPEEIEATREKREATIREWLTRHQQEPVSLPDGMTLQEFLDKHRRSG